MTQSLSKNEISYIIIASFVILSMAYRIIKSGRIAESFSRLLIWIAIIFLLITAYAFKNEARYFGRRIAGVLIPHYSWNDSESGTLTIPRNGDGHFYAGAYLNGKKIIFMVDTGASSISLSKEDAKELGFDPASLRYTKEFFTANGVSFSAPVTIADFRIGPLSRKNVRAYVSGGDMDVSLLGMSILESFASFKIEGDLLILKED